MIYLVFKVLKNEGVLINVFLFFFIFSPVYLLDIFLVIPLALLLLHREMLNQTAPSEQIVTLYKVFGLPRETILCSNTLVIIAVNIINGVLLALLSLYAGESIRDFDYLRQVIILNGVLLFAVAFGNGVLYYRLLRSVYYTVHKMVIVPLFLFSVLIVFTILFFLFLDRPILAGVIFLLILLVWMISVFKKHD